MFVLLSLQQCTTSNGFCRFTISTITQDSAGFLRNTFGCMFTTFSHNFYLLSLWLQYKMSMSISTLVRIGRNRGIFRENKKGLTLNRARSLSLDDVLIHKQLWHIKLYIVCFCFHAYITTFQ